jgi:CRP-like cAMP-binding protein
MIRIDLDHSLRTFKRGELLYRAGDSPQGIFCIVSGLIGLVIHAESGNDRLVRLFRSGQFLGHRSLLAHETHHASAVALEPTRVKFFEKSAFLQAIQSKPSLAKDLLQTLARELGESERRLTSFSERSVRSRVAEGLLYLKDLKPDHRWTRKEIAEFCGSTTPSVIRVLSRMESDKIIQQNRREIGILDRKRLLGMAFGK